MNTKGKSITVQYIYHSGFIVELDKTVLVFDYYQGDVNLQGIKGKKIFVFASHAHPDHFNPRIFTWKKEIEDIRYILSHDIHNVPPEIKASSIAPYQDLELGDIQVKGYNSTDIGVAFLVRCEGINIFHAGDLNWWYWWGESAEEIKQAEKLFKEEISKIKGEQIDLAFFPVDPRLERNYSLGAEYFIQEIKPRCLIPMHFILQEDKAMLKEFVEKMQQGTTEVIYLAERGQKTGIVF